MLGEMALKKAIPPHWHVIFGTGMLGALTTFSTFGYDTVRKLESGELNLALLNVLINVAVGLLAVYLGFMAARGILPE